jgi:hypothetical protein
MNYTQKETKDWKRGLKRRKGFRAPKRRAEQLPSPILVVNVITGEYKEVKPVPIKTKTKIKKRRSKKRTKIAP